MKGNSWVFEKTGHFSSLHMKRNYFLLKNEKFFDFLKMDKKNVQKWVAEKVLTEKKIRYDIEKLSS
jgi:hypothetical protein